MIKITELKQVSVHTDSEIRLNINNAHMDQLLI